MLLLSVSQTLDVLTAAGALGWLLAFGAGALGWLLAFGGDAEVSQGFIRCRVSQTPDGTTLEAVPWAALSQLCSCSAAV